MLSLWIGPFSDTQKRESSDVSATLCFSKTSRDAQGPHAASFTERQALKVKAILPCYVQGAVHVPDLPETPIHRCGTYTTPVRRDTHEPTRVYRGWVHGSPAVETAQVSVRGVGR